MGLSGHCQGRWPSDHGRTDLNGVMSPVLPRVLHGPGAAGRTGQRARMTIREDAIMGWPIVSGQRGNVRPLGNVTCAAHASRRSHLNGMAQMFAGSKPHPSGRQLAEQVKKPLLGNRSGLRHMKRTDPTPHATPMSRRCTISSGHARGYQRAPCTETPDRCFARFEKSEQPS